MSEEPQDLFCLIGHAGDAAGVRRLLAAGADPNAESGNGYTPLLEAIGFDHRQRPRLEVTRALLAGGADPNLPGRWTAASLFWTVSESKRPLAEMLFAHGADPNVRLGHRQGVRVYHQCATGMTPLMLAAAMGDRDWVADLLERGADPALIDARGRSAADFAAHARDEQLTNTLVQAGAPLGTGRTAAQNAALWRAVAVNNATGTVRRSKKDAAKHRERDTAAALDALAAGADPNAADIQGKTALCCAAQLGWPEVVAALLDAGADPGRASDWDETPLRHAALRDNAEVVRLLLAGGADVNRRFEARSVPHNDGNTVYPSLETALHDAATYGTVEVLKLLAAAGADRDFVGASGVSPVVAAANFRRMDSVAALLELGAVVRPDDEVWLTPYRFAATADRPAFREVVAEVAAAVGGPGEVLPDLPGVRWFKLTASPAPPSPTATIPAEAGRQWGEEFRRQYDELSRTADELVDRLTARVRAAGFLLLDSGKPIGCGPMVQVLTLLPTADKFGAMAAFGVAANDQQIPTAEVIRRFRELDAVEPFDLRGLKRDTVVIEFRRPVADPVGLAPRLGAFCHGLAGPDEADWAVIADWLRETRRLTFWWD